MDITAENTTYGKQIIMSKPFVTDKLIETILSLAIGLFAILYMVIAIQNMVPLGVDHTITGPYSQKTCL
jgi:hypothetical protein